MLWYYVGLVITGLGYALVIAQGLGASPWDILHLGLTGQTGIPLGRVVQITGAFVILVDVLLGMRPNLGMVLNMLSLGPITQFLLERLAAPATLPGRWLMLVAGIVVSGIGTAFYASADLGAGPRDSLMIGLTRKLGLPVAIVKNGLDVMVSLIGWWLGGPLGAGTVAVAVGLGPSVQLGFHLASLLARLRPLHGIVRPVPLRSATARQ
ncbi:conserved hypothetical protein [Symbiobacterium thermophilum IAM 14863]|uniref:Integral membrane protein n=1 Tax=Symbiobacterium thermophilum (strain DSM 24528 / JCM 14929 / IAM 14863 / T) TaxID=292459 RepID=Q67MI9_SYMTH|nr:conserved hypothetical protein [Symbiobacterium thermophilum IAM 14863]